MTLLLEVIGVLAVGTALSRRDVVRGAALVAVVAAGLLLLDHGVSLVRSMPGAIRSNAALSPAAVAQQPEIAAGAPDLAPFLGWARAQMLRDPASATFWILPASAGADPFTYQWATFELAPARATSRLQEAHWLVLLHPPAGAPGPPPALFGPPRSFAPGLAIVERRHAG